MTPNDPRTRPAPAGPRTVLITGGANGLGAALARRLGAAGDRVAIADTDLESGRRLAEDIGCLFIEADVRVYADIQAAAARTSAWFGGLDAVCVNAGVPGGSSIGEDFDPDRYRQAMAVNLDGAVYALNAALPQLRARGRGAVLITSSLAGIAPALDVYYSAAKHALIGLTRSFALILSNEDITVNAICPGFIDTQLIAGVRSILLDGGFAIAGPDEVATAAVTVLDSSATGQIWEVQAGRPARQVTFEQITLSRTDEHPK